MIRLIFQKKLIFQNKSIKRVRYLCGIFIPVFFILSTEKFFEMFPRNNGVATLSESFALNSTISVRLTNK